MAKLILSVDGTVLKEISLMKERTTLGRKPHNDIQVDNLAVSGEHAAIITILNDSFIEDLNSTNGTLVNGKPIKKHFLQNNDVIEIGKHKLKYFGEAPVQVSAQEFEKTMIIRKPPTMPASVPAPVRADSPSMSDTQTNMRPLVSPPETLSAPPPLTTQADAPHVPRTPQAPHIREAAIQVLSGAAAGRTLDLVKNLTTIGKPGVQVAVVTRRPSGFFLTHVEGASFPILNGVLMGAQAQPLNDHATIEIAGVKMEFFYKP
jgi:FHA domain